MAFPLEITFSGMYFYEKKKLSRHSASLTNIVNVGGGVSLFAFICYASKQQQQQKKIRCN
jgi:hypothetical protein